VRDGLGRGFLILSSRHCCREVSHWACQNVLSVETHRRAATGNTKSREVAGALAGTAPSSTARNSVTRPEIPWKAGRATRPTPDQVGANVLQIVSCVQRHV